MCWGGGRLIVTIYIYTDILNCLRVAALFLEHDLVFATACRNLNGKKVRLILSAVLVTLSPEKVTYIIIDIYSLREGGLYVKRKAVERLF